MMSFSFSKTDKCKQLDRLPIHVQAQLQDMRKNWSIDQWVLYVLPVVMDNLSRRNFETIVYNAPPMEQVDQERGFILPKFSHRQIEWFVINTIFRYPVCYPVSFSSTTLIEDAKENEPIETFCARDSYLEQIKHFHKRYFDTVRRGDRLLLIDEWHGYEIEMYTTVAQLNFFYWFVGSGLFQWLCLNRDFLMTDIAFCKKQLHDIREQLVENKRRKKLARSLAINAELSSNVIVATTTKVFHLVSPVFLPSRFSHSCASINNEKHQSVPLFDEDHQKNDLATFNSFALSAFSFEKPSLLVKKQQQQYNIELDEIDNIFQLLYKEKEKQTVLENRKKANEKDSKPKHNSVDGKRRKIKKEISEIEIRLLKESEKHQDVKKTFPIESIQSIDSLLNMLDNNNNENNDIVVEREEDVEMTTSSPKMRSLKTKTTTKKQNQTAAKKKISKKSHSLGKTTTATTTKKQCIAIPTMTSTTHSSLPRIIVKPMIVESSSILYPKMPSHHRLRYLFRNKPYVPL